MGHGTLIIETSNPNASRTVRSENLETRLRRALDSGSVPGVLAAYLFGSRAEDRAHRESDVDVGVLLERDRYPDRADRFEARLRLIGELSAGLGTDEIDVVILNDAPPELGRRIVTSGARIFCADEPADHAYVRDVQLRAADLDPFLRRMRRIKLEHLSR